MITKQFSIYLNLLFWFKASVQSVEKMMIETKVDFSEHLMTGNENPFISLNPLLNKK